MGYRNNVFSCLDDAENHLRLARKLLREHEVDRAVAEELLSARNELVEALDYLRENSLTEDPHARALLDELDAVKKKV